MSRCDPLLRVFPPLAGRQNHQLMDLPRQKVKRDYDYEDFVYLFMA